VSKIVRPLHGASYGEIIKFLSEETKDSDNKLRYASFHHFGEIDIMDNFISIPTTSGGFHKTIKDEQENEKKVFVSGYRIRIDTSNWSLGRIESLKSKIKIFKNEYKKNGKRHYLFFVGAQNELNFREYIMDDYRLFTCLENESKKYNPK
jgi:hypothetical protein